MGVLVDLDPEDHTRISVHSEYHQKELIKAIPGARWSSQDRVWKLPTAWTSCLALRNTFQEQLTIGHALTEWAKNELTTRIKPAEALREVLDLEDDNAPDTVFTREALKLQHELGLFPHQAAGAAFMATVQQAGIFDDTGTGKTAQTIAALRVLHRLDHTVFPALVIAPNTVKKTWLREFAQWWPGLKVEVISGSAAARRKSLQKPAHVYIMNWDIVAKHSALASYGNMALKRCVECGGTDERVTVTQCQVHKRELNYLQFNTVIADEIQRGKSPQTAFTRSTWKASEGATYRFGLTGTPIQDTITDLWAILRFISPDEYPAKTKFIDRFAESGINMWGIFQVYGLRKDAEDEFHAGVDPRYRRMLKEAVLPHLPPISRESRFVEMKGAQRKAYRQMLKDTITELEGGPLIAENPLSKATRLIQFSSAYAELDTYELDDGRVKSTPRLSNPSNKIEGFLDDIDAAHYGKEEWKGGDFGDSSIVVFAQSRQLINLLHEAMDKHGIPHGMITGEISTDDRQTSIDEFQEGKTRYILCTIDAGGVGLTLTAANVAVYLQRHWSSISMKQSENRIHRIGSEVHDNVTIVNYISEDTIEEQQLMKIGQKYDRIESVLHDQELLKKLLTNKDIEVESIPDPSTYADDYTEEEESA